MFCVACGKPYEPKYNFCNYCGVAVTGLPFAGGNATGSPQSEKASASEPATVAVSIPTPEIETILSTTAAFSEPLANPVTISQISSQWDGVVVSPSSVQKVIVSYLGFIALASLIIVVAAEQSALGDIEHSSAELSAFVLMLLGLMSMLAIAFAVKMIKGWKAISRAHSVMPN